MKILVTGASGFLGRNFLARVPRDWQVLAVYRNDASFPAFVAGLDHPSVCAVRCDLANNEAVQSIFRARGVDWGACIYFSAKVDIPWSVHEPREDLRLNVDPLINVLDAIRCGRFIYFSSGAVYDGIRGEVTSQTPVSPTLPYAISKLAAEHYVRFFWKRRNSIGKFINVRFFGAYGPWEAAHKIYTRLVRAFVDEGKTEYSIYGDGRNLIDAMYVDDAVNAVFRILSGSTWNRTINLAAGNPLTIEELVREAGRVLDKGEVQVRKEGVAHENIEFWASANEIRDQLRFEPGIPLGDGLPRLRDFLAAGSGRG